MTPATADGATYLSIPGELVPIRAEGDGTDIIPTGVVAAVTAVLIAILFSKSRRRRSMDPAERAFRRIARDSNLTRAQVRALRHEAAARGLDSPVGLAMSTELIGQAERRHTKRRRTKRTASPA